MLRKLTSKCYPCGQPGHKIDSWGAEHYIYYRIIDIDEPWYEFLGIELDYEALKKQDEFSRLEKLPNGFKFNRERFRIRNFEHVDF